MIWQFTWEEGLKLDLRLFSYAFFRIGLLSLALWLQVQGRQHTSMVDVQFILTITSILTAGLGIYLASIAVGQLVMRFLGVLFNWSRFQVIEQNDNIVGCALLNSYINHCELAYVFVNPHYRHQGLGSMIVQMLIQQSPHDLYLACKSQVVPFYEQQGFRSQTWKQLPLSVRRCFQVFRPHPRLWGFALNFMLHTAAPLPFSSESASLAKSSSR